MDIVGQIIDLYQKIDKIIDRFKKVTDLDCPRGCSYCCRHWWVEATVLEVLPLAMEIYNRGQEEAIMKQIQERQACEESLCVLLLPESNKEVDGYCAYYAWRPLMCRLFGFAARKNKHGQLEFCSCRIIREVNPWSVRRAEMALQGNLKVPVYQEAFMEIASLDTSRGFHRLPINLAIKEAIEYLYWKRPKGKSLDKVAGF